VQGCPHGRPVALDLAQRSMPAPKNPKPGRPLRRLAPATGAQLMREVAEISRIGRTEAAANAASRKEKLERKTRERAVTNLLLADPGIATSKHAGPATSKQDHLTAPRRPRPRCPQAELTVRADSQQAYADLPTPFPGDDHLARAASTARAFFVADRLAAFKRIGIENHRYRDLSSVFITAHSITSSAKASRLGGMVRPTALAVLRLIARWNLGIAPASR
jgi:hypothetical protein